MSGFFEIVYGIYGPLLGLALCPVAWLMRVVGESLAWVGKRLSYAGWRLDTAIDRLVG